MTRMIPRRPRPLEWIARSNKQAALIEIAPIYKIVHIYYKYISYNAFRDSTTDWRTEKNMSKIQTNLTVFAVCIEEGYT